MKHVILLFIFYLAVLGCRDVTTSQGDKHTRNDVAQVGTQEKGVLEHFECTRGQATPIVRKSVFPNSTFQLNIDSISGIEEVELINNERLTIRNEGCEYYNLEFTLETFYQGNHQQDIPFWYHKAISFMDSIKKGIDAPLVIAGIDALKKHVRTCEKDNYKGLKLQEEIEYSEGEMRQIVTFNNITLLANNKCKMKLTFSLGPL
jgi:hypothetical protein